jgi:hypothetical protein
MLLAGKSISRKRDRLYLKDAAVIVIEQYGLSCVEAGQLPDVPACE